MSIETRTLRTAADSDFCTKRITLYKYITPVALAGLIQHGDIKLTYRKDANDPFECLPDGNIPEDDTLAHLGILSLTSKCLNHPMWGNYADKYRGACIEFGIDYFSIESPDKTPKNKGEKLAIDTIDFAKLGTTALFFQYWEDGERKVIDQRGGDVLLKCEYTHERSDPQNCFWSNTRQQDLAGRQKWFRQIITKHADWQYEDEYRVTMRHNRCSRFSVGPPTMYFTNAFTRYITKIILGPRCEYSPLEIAFLISKSRKQLAEQLYIPREVKIVKAKFQERSFTLEIPEEEDFTNNYSIGIF